MEKDKIHQWSANGCEYIYKLRITRYIEVQRFLLQI